MEQQLARQFGKDQWNQSHFVSFVEQLGRDELMQRFNEMVPYLTGQTHMNETVTTKQKVVEPRVAKFTTLGTLSVAAKHWSAFFDMLYQGYRYVLVVEDDIVFSPRLHVSTVLHSLPDHWSNCYLKNFRTKPCEPVAQRFRWGHLQYSAVCRQARGHGSNDMVAYLLSRDGACRLLRHWPLVIDPDHHADALSRADPHFATYSTIRTLVYEADPKAFGGRSWA